MARKVGATLDRVRKMQPIRMSTSFHSWAEMEADELGYSYVFISPVFDSISKPGYVASVDINAAVPFKKYMRSHEKNCPEIIGLGGVDATGIVAVHKKGFDGAAVLGCIWKATDRVGVFQQLQEVILSLER
jgi:thiamine-phosphate pyrophosphorylase